MFESHALHRTSIASVRDHTIYGSLSRRAQSPGAQKQAAATPLRSRRTPRLNRTASAARRNAQLLLSPRRLTGCRVYFWTIRDRPAESYLTSAICDGRGTTWGTGHTATMKALTQRSCFQKTGCAKDSGRRLLRPERSNSRYCRRDEANQNARRPRVTR